MSSHLISNYKQLAITPLREDAFAILEAGLRAVRTQSALERTITLTGEKLRVDDRTYDLREYKNIYVIGIGKAAFDAGCFLEKILGDRITDGVVIDVKGGVLSRVTSRIGTHPFPSSQNMKATGEMLALLKQVQPDDLLVVVVSGGGSALLCWPMEMSCEELTALTKGLMRQGASIFEMNIIRKHSSDILGGQLAAMVHRATTIGLIFSDVPGDRLPMVASGPTYLDETTLADAQQILHKYDLINVCHLPACNLKETPKDPSLFYRVKNTLVVSGKQAIEAMEQEGKKRGYHARIISTELTGEARLVGKRLALDPKPGELVLACGETTVSIKGKGKGGRNQELALGALSSVPENGLVLSCATDGADNSDVAGAVADMVTHQKARQAKLNPLLYLERNDSYTFFSQIGEHIITGVTGMNVSDIMLSIREKN